MTTRSVATVGERFWAKVSIVEGEGCWLWTGARGAAREERDKYGICYLTGSGPTQTVAYAHRLAYALTYGPIPDGLLVRHSCDTRLCCRPDHLLTGDDGDNLRDQYARDRRPQAAGAAQGKHGKRWGGRAKELRVPDGKRHHTRRD